MTGTRVGIDLVRVSRMAELVSDEAFLRRAFHPSELGDLRAEHLAGVFAAKEACFKALGCAPGWLAVSVESDSGRPRLRLSPTIEPPGLMSIDVSISHEGDYAVASVVLLVSVSGDDGADGF